MASVNGPPVNGVEPVALESSWLSVTTLPAAGGIITNLVDRQSGRDWLWHNPHIAAETRGTHDDYGRYLDAGGWDEILLSITADEIELPSGKRQAVPDHGDLVRRRWQRTDDGSESNRCALTATGDHPRYEFSREVHLAETSPTMTIRYSLTNQDDYSWPMYWCAHALLAIEPGMLIDLPDAQPYRVDSATGKLNPNERIRRWPDLETDDLGGIDLSESLSGKVGEGAFAAKFFVASPPNGVVQISTPDRNETLTMRYDRSSLPWLGLWINNRGWAAEGRPPYFNLGLEPSTAPYDSVSEAVRNSAVPLIEPGETLQWLLTVDLSS